MANEQQNINVSLTVEEVNLVISALAELPAKVSMGLINKVTVQAQQQLQASVPGATPEVSNG